MTKEEMLRLLTAAYTGPGSAAEGTFAGDVLRACADGMAQLWSMEIDGLERRAFVSSAVGEWLTAVCADRGCVRKEGETDEELRAFIADALEKRAPFYVQARYRFDAGHLESRRQIAGSVQQLRSLLGI